VTRAESFIAELYSSFEGRVPFAAGYTTGFLKKVYPLVYEDSDGTAIGLIAAAANSEEDTSEVQLFHVSAFRPGNGHGKKIMEYLCKLADKHSVKIYLQAEIQFTERETPIGESLVNWYKKFGFVGNTFMRREPDA
jgi:GNAT superfamily N-acetyltransferase